MKKILAMIMVTAMALTIVSTSYAMPKTGKRSTTSKHAKASKTHQAPVSKSGKAGARHKVTRHTAKHTTKHAKKHIVKHVAKHGTKHTAKHKVHRTATHTTKHTVKHAAKPVAKKKK